MMALREVKGDLFTIAEGMPGAALAHCISEDCVMGKGIATSFKSKFGGVDELKIQVAKGKISGTAACLERDGRLVFYLITKKRYNHKPTYDTLRHSLEDMLNQMKRSRVDALVMPRIGCGLDGLQWQQVKTMLEQVFAGSSIDVVVCTL